MTSRQWFEKAKKEKFALGAFNVGNLEFFKAIIQAAANKKSPIIVESSPGETAYLGADNIVDLARNFSQKFGIPILVNLDHAGSLEECLAGIEAGYDMIHFDGSKLPYEQNLETSKKVVKLAHSKGVLVEGEIDYIAGSSEVHHDLGFSEIPMTDSQKAAQFIKDSGIDILAVFIGNLHGIFLQGGENLDLLRLQQIAAVTNCYLSLHGGSGIPNDQIKEAIKDGIVKINISTQMRQVFKENLEEVLKENPNEYALYKIEEPVVHKVQKVVEQKIEIFGSANKI